MEAAAGKASAAAAEAHEAAELASNGVASVAASEAVTEAGAASGSAAALQQPLKAAQPGDGNPAQEAKSAADKESEALPSSLERYEADLASEDASSLEEDLDLTLAGGAAAEQEQWPGEDRYAGEKEDIEAVGDDELWIDQRYLAGDPEDDAEDGVSVSGAADADVQEAAQHGQAGLPEGMADTAGAAEKGAVPGEPAVLTGGADTAGSMQKESLGQAGASSEHADTVQQEGAALPKAEQPAASREVDVKDSAVEGNKEPGGLVRADEGAVSADDLEEEERSDIDYILDAEEDDADIDGLDALYGEDDESGADSKVLEDKADASLAEAGP